MNPKSLLKLLLTAVVVSAYAQGATQDLMETSFAEVLGAQCERWTVITVHMPRTPVPVLGSQAFEGARATAQSRPCVRTVATMGHKTLPNSAGQTCLRLEPQEDLATGLD